MMDLGVGAAWRLRTNAVVLQNSEGKPDIRFNLMPARVLRYKLSPSGLDSLRAQGADPPWIGFKLLGSGVLMNHGVGAVLRSRGQVQVTYQESEIGPYRLPRGPAQPELDEVGRRGALQEWLGAEQAGAGDGASHLIPR